MTNQELYQEIKELRKEVNKRFDKADEKHETMMTNLNVFKVRAAYFMGAISLLYAVGVDFIKKKLGI